jgi:hypothetical protein
VPDKRCGAGIAGEQDGKKPKASFSSAESAPILGFLRSKALKSTGQIVHLQPEIQAVTETDSNLWLKG